jgi:hypothetical protein
MGVERETTESALKDVARRTIRLLQVELEHLRVRLEHGIPLIAEDGLEV